MEDYTLGGKLPPNPLPIEKRMGKEQWQERLHKESLMLKNKIPPAKKGALSHIIDKIVIKRLMPSIYLLGNGKLNKKLREGYTNFQITQKEIHIKDLDPQLRGLKIAHISDLHLDLKESFPTALSRFLKREKPHIDLCDLVVITGDFQDKYLDPTNRTVEGFKKLTEFIEPPIIGTLGNHDRIELAPQLESLPSHNGIRILLNETLKIKTKGGAKLILHGIDDPHYYKTHNIKKLNHKELKILLSHSPEVYKEAQTKEMDICLCGHTHAGQLRLPALGAVVKSAKVPKRLLQGTWCYKSLIGHTSPGLGCSGLSIRLLCPPEISILTLK